MLSCVIRVLCSRELQHPTCDAGDMASLRWSPPAPLRSMPSTQPQGRHSALESLWVVQALHSAAAERRLSPEQIVSIISAAGHMGTALPPSAIPPKLALDMTHRLASAERTWSASACASYLHGVSVLNSSELVYVMASEAFVTPWVRRMRPSIGRFTCVPAEFLGVLEACAKHGLKPQQAVLADACKLAGIILLVNEGYEARRVRAATLHPGMRGSHMHVLAGACSLQTSNLSLPTVSRGPLQHSHKR